MKIQWHGGTQCTLVGKNATVIIDQDISKKGDVYFYSTFEEGRKEPEEAKILDWPGEYEVKGVNITALQGKDGNDQDNLVFYFEIGRIKVCHLGKIGPDLTPEMIQEISETDILFIPISGENTLDAKKAHEVIEQIEPRIVIPMNFESNDPNIAAFIKEMGIHDPEISDKFEIKNRTQLPEDRTEYIILEKA